MTSAVPDPAAPRPGDDAPGVDHPRSKGGSARGRQVSARRVRDLIAASIRDGLIAPDDPLAEEELMELFNTSRGSVRAALGQLRDAGFVERRRRVGTKVSRMGVTVPLSDIRTDSENVVISITEERQVPSFPLVRERLQLDDATVRMVENIFVADDEVIGLRTAYFSTTFQDPGDSLRGPVTMTTVIGAFFGRTPGAATVLIGSDSADARTARMLGVAEGMPLIVREMTYFDDDGAPIQTVFDRFRGDRVRLEATAFVA
jgi:GntR family transcriptional regulator